MSDDQSQPPKPKVSSLRDRIAAFEKSASSASSAPAPPPPRPKPAGFASWKPKPPSPPGSPSANASTSSASSAAGASRPGGMSVTDAKESITKGGSLKERMAALQGKGAFGAPPPVAPKPPVEKPKWKPPPAVAPPIDDDDHAGVGSSATADIAAAVERTISPPSVTKSPEPTEGAVTEGDAETAATKESPIPQAADDGEQETPADPEEEERQRRAAIAARMARLGGARLGMAPPVFGKKPPPPPKKSTSIHEEDKPRGEVISPEPIKSPEPTSAAELPLSSEPESVAPPVESPEIKATGEEIPSSAAAIETPQAVTEEKESVDSTAATGLPTPSLKSSTNVSTHSPEATEPQAPRVPTSMPVPSVPRRAGPPRKKPAKPSAPPPEVPEEPMVVDTDNQAAELKADIEAPEIVQEAKEPEEPAKEAEESKASPERIEEKRPTSPEEKSPEVEGGIDAAKGVSDEVEADRTSAEENEHITSPVPASKPVQQEVDQDQPISEEEGGITAEQTADVLSPPPIPIEETVKDVADVEVEEKRGEETVEEKEDDEEIRKRNIAERLAKMGGVNPFGPPPVRSPPLVKSPPPTSPPLAATTSDLPGSPPVIPAAAVPLPTSPPPQTTTSPPLQVKEQEQEEDSDESEYEDEDRALSPEFGEQRQHKPLHESSALGQADEAPETISSSVLPPRDSEQDEDETYEEAATPAPPKAIPLANTSALEEEPASPPTRTAQLPPRRFVPQTPEERDDDDNEESDEEMNESITASRLFIPPPTGHRSHILEHPGLRYLQDDDDGNGSESDIAPIPVPPQRMSMEMLRTREDAAAVIAARAGVLDSPRSPRSEYSETESDHDGQPLPIPPRHASGLPPPRLVPPPPPSHPPPSHVAQPDITSNASVSDSLDDDSAPPSPTARFMPSVYVESSEEILEENEGDPIDPSFHSPSRQGSHQNLREAAAAQSQTAIAASTPLPTSPPPSGPSTNIPPSSSRQAASSPPPPPRRVSIPAPATADPAQGDEEEDAEQARRRTIAERMAKLGGIKFGGAPPTRPPPPVRRPTQDTDEQSPPAEPVQSGVEEEQSTDLTEEEEERARKERIAAKLMGMGGMRIGMMPMGRPPVKSRVLTDEQVPTAPSNPVPPARAVPPARPPPPPAPPVEDDSEHESAAASEDGVKVEAEESEIEEVGYEDLAESQIIEDVPPPPPSRVNRGAHRRESTEIPASPPASPPPPPPPARPSSRPPIPSVPSFTRRSSVQTTAPSTTSQTYQTPSEYVMVEESEVQEAEEEEEETPPPPPARPARPPPSRAAPQAPPVPVPNPSDSISSQWELPSIPTASLDFGGSNDLSMSWTDAGEALPAPAAPASDLPPQPPAARKSSTAGPSEQPQLSPDELIVIWGRVGVQVCEVATTLFEKSKRSLIGDGSYAGFVHAALSGVPNVAPAALEGQNYGYLIYQQNGASVQKRISDIMPGDILEIHDGKFKGHKGLQTYHREVGGGDEVFVGVVGEFEAKKMKMKVLQANQHVGQQTVESVSYKLEDLKSGVVKVYRVLEA
ncbi:hypothetical protein CVT24_003707 [Panaeolus cyanescens]|uniref:BBC1/AIM3 cysteine proteinase-fold domain-containing protein n=1 Tax=Panaeolus cyanescens TaxID=181874 RepID=A0A409YXM0_9AGAR|nr:hypothetical protein CVT24_003707 [Panaeolus cyanescens]